MSQVAEAVSNLVAVVSDPKNAAACQFLSEFLDTLLDPEDEGDGPAYGTFGFDTVPAGATDDEVAASMEKAPVVSDIYKRIVDEMWALDQLKLEIVKTHPASGDWCDQAKDKLGKAIDQMKKADLKTAVRA